ncbi:transposase [Nocardia fusca]|uniref:transposase n=1 Tax=Nocardia fusca TaxID=941183 RepID=UPI0037C86303
MRERRCRYPGRYRSDDRAALEGILYVVRMGIGWNKLRPGCSMCRQRPAGRRLSEWSQAAGHRPP